MKTSVLLILIFLPGFATGQTTITLDNFLRMTTEVLTLKSSNYDKLIYKIKLKGEKAKRIPTLNFNMSGGLLTGRSINPTTNAYDINSLAYQNIGLQSNIPIYDWGQTSNNIKRLTHEANDKDFVSKNELLKAKETVINLYCDLLIDQKKIENQLITLEKLSEGKRIVIELLKKNRRTILDSLEVENQIFADSTLMLNLRNSFNQKKRDLFDFFNLSVHDSIKFSFDSIPVPYEIFDNEAKITEYAIARNPSYLSELEKLRAIEYNIKNIKKARYPKISLSFNVNTNYSRPLNGSESPDYFNTLYNNIGNTIFLGLSLPILDQSQTRYSRQILALEEERQKDNIEIKNNSINTYLTNMIESIKYHQQQILLIKNHIDNEATILEQKKILYKYGRITTLEMVNAIQRQKELINNEIEIKYTLSKQLKILQLYME